MLPSLEMARWPAASLQSRLGTVGAAIFLDKFRVEQNGHVWVPQEHLPIEVRKHTHEILKTALQCFDSMTKMEMESLKSIHHVISVLRKLPLEKALTESDIIAK